MPMHLTHQTKITRVANAAAAGTDNVDGAYTDMTGFNGVRAIALLGDVTSGSKLTLQFLQADTSGGSGEETLAGPVEFTAGATDADNKVMVTDVLRPSKRYVKVRLKRTTQNAVVDGVLMEQYAAKDLPTVHGSTVLQTDILTDPAAA